MREFARAGLSEKHPVPRPQPPVLAFIVRPVGGELTALVNEAVPHVDIDGAGTLGPRAIEVIEIDGVRGGLGAFDRRQADPEYRHALTLKRGDRVVDALRINLGPLVAAKFYSAIGFFALLRFGRDRRLFGIVRRLFIVGGLIGLALILRVFFLFVFLLVVLRLLFFRKFARADVLAIGDTKHHHHVIGFLLRQDIPRHVPPIEIALALIAQQARMILVLADDRDFGRI